MNNNALPPSPDNPGRVDQADLPLWLCPDNEGGAERVWAWRTLHMPRELTEKSGLDETDVRK
jgi:hypothetical protein